MGHGRNSFQRSARLTILIIHRGLIYSILQVFFSEQFWFTDVPLFQGVLNAGWPTVFTGFLLFSVVLDSELPEHTVLLYPELYAGLRAEQRLSFKTYLIWLFIALWQASSIMVLTCCFFEGELINIVSIVFTSCFLIECLSVASEVSLWHPLVVVGEFISVLIFAYSVALVDCLNLPFIFQPWTCAKLAAIILVAWLPLYTVRYVVRILQPSQHRKLVEQET